MKQIFPFILLAACTATYAETPRGVADGYAAAEGATFQVSAQRGAVFYARRFGVSDKMPGCAACHMEHPTQDGRHAVTGKSIKPLSPSANPERFTDAAKVEKWFKRNCKEVVGRECSAGEKADFIAYVTEGR
jgi:hypothetical protein